MRGGRGADRGTVGLMVCPPRKIKRFLALGRYSWGFRDKMGKMGFRARENVKKRVYAKEKECFEWQ